MNHKTKLFAICSGTGVAPFISYAKRRKFLGKQVLDDFSLIYCLNDKNDYCIEKQILEENTDDILFVESRNKPDNTFTLEDALEKRKEKIIEVIENNGRINICG